MFQYIANRFTYKDQVLVIISSHRGVVSVVCDHTTKSPTQNQLKSYRNHLALPSIELSKGAFHTAYAEALELKKKAR